MRANRTLLALAVVAVLLLANMERPESTEKRGATGVDHEWEHLLPAFAQRLRAVFAALVARGFDPYLHEGLRSRQRAESLAADGSGIRDSMHIYGAAADVISASRHWEWPEFFAALGAESERAGLTWGGRFGGKDLDHVQAVPVPMQARMRAARSAKEADALVKKALGLA